MGNITSSTIAELETFKPTHVFIESRYTDNFFKNVKSEKYLEEWECEIPDDGLIHCKKLYNRGLVSIGRKKHVGVKFERDGFLFECKSVIDTFRITKLIMGAKHCGYFDFGFLTSIETEKFGENFILILKFDTEAG